MSEVKVKAPSAWITHLKAFAKEKGIKYSEALKSADAKVGYVAKVKPAKKEKQVVAVKIEKQEKTVEVKEKKPRKSVVKKSKEEVPLEIIEDVKPVAAKKSFKKVSTVKAAEAPNPL